MEVIILSGLPGSGKSHYTQTLRAARAVELSFPEDMAVEVFSADLFFMKDGEYQFDINKIGEAHAWCFRMFIETLRHLGEPDLEDPILVVDNTNLTAAEIAPYMQAANAFGWPAKVVTIKCDPAVAYKRQVHNVPLGSYFHMFANFKQRQLPPYWKQETISTTNVPKEK